MPVSLEAFAHYQRGLRAKTTESTYTRNAVIEAGRRAQMVVEHPGWQTYVDHLSAIKDKVQESRDTLANQMAREDALGEELVRMKLRLRELDGQLKGLNQAMDLIPEMIKRASDLLEIKERAVPPTAAG